MRDETLCCDLISTFKPDTIRMSSKTNVVAWVEILALRGIHPSSDRMDSLADKLIQLLYREILIGAHPHMPGHAEESKPPDGKTEG